MNAVGTTAGVALGATQVADFVVWAFTAAHLTPPPPAVAGTIATMILIGLHAAYVKWVGNKATPAPVAPPAQ